VAKRLPGRGQPAPAQRFRSPASLEGGHTHPTVPAETRCEQDLPTPTTPPQPAPTPAPASPAVFRYNVSGSNGTCLLASMGLQLNVTYRRVDNKVGRPEPCSLHWVQGRVVGSVSCGARLDPHPPAVLRPQSLDLPSPRAGVSALRGGGLSECPTGTQGSRLILGDDDLPKAKCLGWLWETETRPFCRDESRGGCRKHQKPSACSGLPCADLCLPSGLFL
jgi:hypothetical protein